MQPCVHPSQPLLRHSSPPSLLGFWSEICGTPAGVQVNVTYYNNNELYDSRKSEKDLG